MDIQVTIDWKSILALGGSVALLISLSKLNNNQLENISIHGIDSAKEYAIACHKVSCNS